MEGNPPRKANFPTRCHRHQQEKNMLFLGRFFFRDLELKVLPIFPLLEGGASQYDIRYISVYIYIYGGFLKCCYPTTMGFPTTNDHFGVFWGYHHLRKHPYLYIYRYYFWVNCSDVTWPNPPKRPYFMIFGVGEVYLNESSSRYMYGNMCSMHV